MTSDWALAAPLAASLLMAAFGPKLVRALRPATGVRLAVVCSLVTALAGGFALAVVAFDAVALEPPVAALGHWSVRTLRAVSPMPWWEGAAAGALLVPLFAAVLVRTARVGKHIWLAEATCRQLGPGVGGLVIVDDDRPEAFALQGLHGRTVVTTGMLASLPSGERRVLLAHEASHLSNRHSLLVTLAHLAASANPLLRPVADAVSLGVERWADEDAARTVGDRQLAAMAVARAALAAGPGAPHGALAMAAGSITTRVTALLKPASRPRRSVAALLVGGALALCTSTAALAHITEGYFEKAQHQAALPAPDGLMRNARASIGWPERS